MGSTDNHSKSGLNTNGLIFFFWFLYGVIEYIKTGAWNNGTGYLVFYFIPGLLIWIALTFPARYFFRKTSEQSLVTRLPVLLLIILLATVTKVFASKVISFVSYFKDSFTFAEYFSRSLRFLLTEATIVASILITLLFIIEIYNKYRNESLVSARLESELVKAQLQTLKMQLQPHFLFNVLNTVSNLIRNNQNEKAIDILSSLGDLLRQSFKGSDKSVLSLKEELVFIRQYLDLEMVRFSDQLEIEYTIEDATKEVTIPQMILQPIVENAIKHGISKHLGKAKIGIAAKIKDEALILEVFNTGPKFESESWGVGLTNTQARLEMLEKPGTLSIENVKNGVAISILIPL